MKKQLTFAILLFLPLILSAQEYLSSPEFNRFWQDVEQTKFIEGAAEVKYNGTPYLFECNNASIGLKNGQVINNLTIRYNIYNDEMEIKKGQHYYSIPKEKHFPNFILEEHHFHLKVFKESSKKQIGYFESIVVDSICSLYLRHNIFLQEASEPKPYQEAKPPTFKIKPTILYVSFDEKELYAVKNKSDFLELAPKYQEELTAFIKKNKTKFKKTDSVKQLVDYYNSIEKK
jgi:hypothetical protein